ncbi:MAG: hypothetical protein ACR2P6_01195, partial [Gammaproteobacteria bacterium]
AREMSRASIGFTQQDHASDGMAELKKVFSPEFRNRLDSIIQFGSLGHDSVLRVVDKLILELETQLEDKDVTLELDANARQYIAEEGYDVKMGARPMARVIQEKVKRPLAEKLLFGELSQGGDVRITLDADRELQIICVPNTRKLEDQSGISDESGSEAKPEADKADAETQRSR